MNHQPEPVEDRQTRQICIGCFLLTWLVLGLTSFGLLLPLFILAMVVAAFSRTKRSRWAALSVVSSTIVLVAALTLWPQAAAIAPQYLWPPHGESE